MTWLFFPLHWVLSVLASVLRLGAGKAGPPPDSAATPPILYEFEGCPFCRIAREAVSAAGAPVLVKPCPKGGKRFRPEAAARGGKAQFPYLQDQAAGVALYESADIARHLRQTRGGRRPLLHWLGPLNLLGSQLSTLARLLSGTVARPSTTAPALPLEYRGAERSPGGRLVKERLCSRELPYLWQPAAGAPVLHDPNTGDTSEGALPILRYLGKTYR